MSSFQPELKVTWWVPQHLLLFTFFHRSSVLFFEYEHVSQVLFPVSLPDEGGFDWLDQFLETHPQRPWKQRNFKGKTRSEFVFVFNWNWFCQFEFKVTSVFFFNKETNRKKTISKSSLFKMFRFEVPFALFLILPARPSRHLHGRKVLHGGLGPCAAALVRAERPRAAQDLRGAETGKTFTESVPEGEE